MRTFSTLSVVCCCSPRPDAAPLLRPGIMLELHFWLLSGKHGAALRTLADPDSHASRLAAAIAILRAEYRSRVPTERLAAAAMNLTAFHKHFKHMTSLTRSALDQNHALSAYKFRMRSRRTLHSFTARGSCRWSC
ncbi:AraC family transcriptional regulator [Allomesorhizobium camelthorni]|uniref:AraC family transcriptional regulator n=1 Tax=Allomesorhizobium camelthorni TaxID=475069 RepID=UPI001FE9C159|nr:AraC family transcriptional regulator [Mesorhizobium camelthorni]